MEKYWKEILLGGIAVLVIVPLAVACMLNFRFICTDTTNEWIGFWGGYLGSVIGGLITLFVLRETLKDNKMSQIRQEKVDFCNYISELIGRLCGKINERDIYILRYTSCEQEVGGNKEDLYNALIAQNEAYEILHILTSQLIAKIGNTKYKYIENLMDKIDDLQHAANCDIKFKYTREEIQKLERKCDIIKAKLGNLRDYVVDFIKANID